VDRGGRRTCRDGCRARRLAPRERGSAARVHIGGGQLEAGRAARGAPRMRFEIEVNGRTRTVTVERAGQARYRIAVDGTVHNVDAVRVGHFGLSLLFDGESSKARELLVAPASEHGEVLVTIDGRVASATVDARRTRRPRSEGAGPASGAQPIV